MARTRLVSGNNNPTYSSRTLTDRCADARLKTPFNACVSGTVETRAIISSFQRNFIDIQQCQFPPLGTALHAWARNVVLLVSISSPPIWHHLEEGAACVIARVSRAKLKPDYLVPPGGQGRPCPGLTPSNNVSTSSLFHYHWDSAPHDTSPKWHCAFLIFRIKIVEFYAKRGFTFLQHRVKPCQEE